MTPTKTILPKKYETFFAKVSTKSLILMDIRFSDMITPKIPPVFSPSKLRIEPTLVSCIVATFALHMNVAMDGNNIFAITKNNTVIRGNTNRKGIWSCHPKWSGLKSKDCGNKSEILTYIKRI